MILEKVSTCGLLWVEEFQFSVSPFFVLRWSLLPLLFTIQTRDVFIIIRLSFCGFKLAPKLSSLTRMGTETSSFNRRSASSSRWGLLLSLSHDGISPKVSHFSCMDGIYFSHSTISVWNSDSYYDHVPSPKIAIESRRNLPLFPERLALQGLAHDCILILVAFVTLSPIASLLVSSKFPVTRLREKLQ